VHACVPVDLLPRRREGVALVPVQLLDSLLNFFLVLQYRAQHLFQARLAFLDAGSNQCVRHLHLGGTRGGQHARIDHVHCFWVHPFLHTALLFLQIPSPVLELGNIEFAEIILRSRLAEQAGGRFSFSAIAAWRTATHWLSSLIQSYCFSRFVAPVTWPAFSFASSATSCSSFLIASSASAASCFLALITSSSSRSSVSNRVSVARSSCSRRSASPCSAYKIALKQAGDDQMGTHLALCHFGCERLELVAHLVDAC
jgi:hypothetical protein